MQAPHSVESVLGPIDEDTDLLFHLIDQAKEEHTPRAARPAT